LQSRQYFLPHLAEVTPLKKALDHFKDKKQKFIAHCITGQPRHTSSEMLNPASEAVILIGPEGDFTADEVNLAMQLGYLPVSLGSQRLRTRQQP
jgi:16S rRNA (uracil1498-N3)-methyltransferase